MRDEFSEEMLRLLPRLRVQALALARDRSAADDLVQDAVVNALAGRDRFEPGTNFAAWMHAILRNRFLDLRRRRRRTVDLAEAPAPSLAVPEAQESRLALAALDRAMGRLPPRMREALVMVAVLGMPYGAVAAATGCGEGTAKSRVFRARERLRAMLPGEAEAPVPGRPRRPARRTAEPPIATAAGV
jgi:RNA polymerase sigma-70 factor, ECF subfamily